ncbi:hypothetical protein [Lysinibacillus sp. S2017]|uniref:hypothetical protein n=1 Tax=Lysinibacillus sp. S2017 TaxID=2561923 RepID=UPI001092E075|nr:hypothetical protein [Lysinibacillus sp. S2017]TGN30378.1 hypothetical protein E4L99_17645 [Lysinibacillus sp. S2017]
MSKIFTKLSSLALATAVVGSGFSVNASAAELESQVIDSNEFNNAVFYETQENVGVSEVVPGVGNPNVIVPYGVSKPTSIWNLSSQGTYSFGGSSGGADLYTDYLLTGKSSVTIKVRNNDHQYSLKFVLKRKDLIFDTTVGGPWQVSVGPGTDGSVTVSGLDKSANYYIQFTGPNNFNGSIY